MQMATQPEVTIGNPQVWPEFGTRNALFVERLDRLRLVFRKAFGRMLSAADAIDKFIFMAGHMAVDDFLEILLLAANAETYGAMKVLRPMFERVVTLLYLKEHPDDIQKYLNYYWIDQHKLIHFIETTFQRGVLDPETVKEAEGNYKRVRDAYKITDCEKCGTTRPGISWTPKDILTMAKEIGLSDFIVPAYYIPLQHTHPKVKGMLDRLRETKDGRLAPDDRLQPLEADRNLCVAHGLVLFALTAQFEYFKLDHRELEDAVNDYREIWKARTDLAAGDEKLPIANP
jgi:hypothetical protein